MKSSKTSFLRNCISGWNVRQLGQMPPLAGLKSLSYLCTYEMTRSSDAVLGS